MAEGGTLPNDGYDSSNFGNQDSIAFEVSVLGIAMEGNELGYSFGLCKIYYFASRVVGATVTSTQRWAGEVAGLAYAFFYCRALTSRRESRPLSHLATYGHHRHTKC
jgi:lipopolysaccharide assembly outer membrane protein LptD (OstA)